MNKAVRVLAGLVDRVPNRARWSMVDQVLISGVSVLTTILLVRTLGLHEFGIYTLIMIGVQFLAGVQTAGILSPMMSLFDKRGEVTPAAYLSAVIVHQSIFALVMFVVIAIAWMLRGWIAPELSAADFALIGAVAVATQFQDLARRFFYVTDRPAQACLSDVIAYGGRIALMALLAYGGELSIGWVWVTIIATSAAAMLVILPDLLRLEFARPAVDAVTLAHRKLAGWLVGSNFVSWFSETNFALLVIGSALGTEELGASRAILALVVVVNLLLQSLENFVPSAASKAYVTGGGTALLDYMRRVSISGIAFIGTLIAAAMVFADPIMHLVYGRTFPDQLAIMAIFGAQHAFVFITMVITAGLRAVDGVGASFWTQVVMAAVSVAGLWIAVHIWGTLGALSVLLLVRMALAGVLGWLLLRRARGTKVTS